MKILGPFNLKANFLACICYCQSPKFGQFPNWPRCVANDRCTRNEYVYATLAGPSVVPGHVQNAEERLFGRDAFYKLGTERGVLKQLYSRSEFSILQEKLFTLAPVGTEENSLHTVDSSQSLTGGQGYTRCSCTTRAQQIAAAVKTAVHFKMS
ncbi:uncharacterized protein TNCT_667521 [Trichonephila clavata]|uniref:Uncharacterized protein n=1 Tax=Trichonephila clavata TaxID=2740835 RepID=A0A8X6K9N5_TRICU|nr:uncharacterized protein TNCT_667521 [Trichonephila clavata]